MNIQDVVTNDAGKLSHSKIWTNIAYAASTYCILYESWHGTLDWTMLLVYLAIVGASPIAGKMIELKYGTHIPEPPK
jgi:hypothetical protein